MQYWSLQRTLQALTARPAQRCLRVAGLEGCGGSEGKSMEVPAVIGKTGDNYVVSIRAEFNPSALRLQGPRGLLRESGVKPFAKIAQGKPPHSKLCVAAI
jgi:hypothetical protein